MAFPANKVYGVMKAVIKRDEGESTSHRSGMSHFNLICHTPEGDYQVNIDIQSSENPNVRMLQVEHFNTGEIGNFASIPPGFRILSTDAADPLALDLIHRPLFSIDELADAKPGSADEISSVLNDFLLDGTEIIVFGTRYDDSNNDAHKPYQHEHESYRNKHLYGVRRHRELAQPPRGVDDVHLNQGTPSSQYQSKDNGSYQDGALFVKNEDGSYRAFFFAFAGQCFNTDPQGNCTR